MSQLRFDGRVVVVTGAGAGLGRAYALLFASRGAKVVVNDLGTNIHGDGNNTQSADIVVKEIQQSGGIAVANYDSVLNGEKIIKTAIDMFGRIDVLVNNAGVLRDASFMKMSEEQWDTILNIHLKGSMKTTQAAWPYFVKQQYGRVIFTSSNSGLYGNFGQANYSSAKLGLVGLANTLAIEGERKNIYTNVITPTAGSRLTKDVLPSEFFDQLKPELIAPVVFWLCHENCNENGSIIESALGWAGKCYLIRSAGCILRQDLSSDVTPEVVQNNWSHITDMTKAKHFNSLGEVTGQFMNVIENLSKPPSMQSPYVIDQTYNNRDVILYALGVGASLDESQSELHYLYENHNSFTILPTFYTLFGSMGCMQTSIVQDSVPTVEINPAQILHGEQYLEVFKHLPAEATVQTHLQVQDVLNKEKGILLLIKHDTYDETGDLLSVGQIAVFIVGPRIEGKRTSQHIIPTIDHPTRKPDVTVTQKTSINQAALYRLSGDLNPLHIDSTVATMAGFKTPILHGLCSLGFSVRHVLKQYAGSDPSLFKSVKVRFSKPVIPGQTLSINMWRNGNRIHFHTSVAETNVPVVTGAYVDLVDVIKPPRTMLCSGKIPLQSDAVFTAIGEQVKTNPEEVKKVNGIFLYNITVNGKPASEWTLDLKNGEVHKGKPKSGKADTTLTVDDKDMVDIALGKLNAQTAFMRGKLKITGNIMLTQKLKKLMEMNKAKL